VQPVLGHRLLLTPEAAMGGRSATGVLSQILNTVPIPETGRSVRPGAHAYG